MVEDLAKIVKSNSETLEERADHTDRIAVLEETVVQLREDLELCKKESVVDYDALCNKQDFLDLAEKVTAMRVTVDSSEATLAQAVEKLDNLAETIKKPLSRISGLEDRCDRVEVDLHNKVNNHDLYHQLAQKVSTEKARQIEQAVVDLQGHIG